MDQIFAQVRRARRKLSLELFFRRLLRCWFVALIVAVAAIGLPTLVAIDGLPANWAVRCSAAAIALGFVVAGIWTLLVRSSELDAAVEIDLRYGLRERVASSLSLSAEAAETAAGQALLSDAKRAVARIDVTERFRVGLGARPWLPLVPAVAAFVLATLIEDPAAQSRSDPVTPKITQEQHASAAKALRERLTKLRKKAAGAKELQDVEGLLRELEKQADQLAQTRQPSRKKSLVKLNDLAKQLEKRRQRLGGEQRLRTQFEKMNNLNRGPADKMVEAMKQGNWKQAAKELKELQEKMARGKLDAEAQKQLQEQIKQLQEKLEDAAEVRQQVKNELQKQIEQEKQQGNLARAGELQQKLDQMEQQQGSLNKLKQLSQQMGQCQQCMQGGDAKGAAKALGQMMEQMQQMQQEMAEGELLDAALDQLQMAKGAMLCGKCQGQGCQDCQGPGAGGDRFGENGGNGMGAGRGFGPRPDEKNDVRFRDSKVRQDPRKGAAVVVGEVDGPNVRGAVAESIKEQMISQGSEPADPLTIEQLPKSRREHAEEYFNSLRGE